MIRNILGCSLGALSLVLGACSVDDKYKITKLKYEVCYDKNNCQEFTSENFYWGDVKDIKMIPVEQNFFYKGLVMIKSRGCIGWHDEPQEVSYYWDLAGVSSDSTIDVNDVKVTILEKEVIPKNKHEEVISQATINAINDYQSSLSIAHCYSKEQIN